MLERIWSYPLHHVVGSWLMDRDLCFVTARTTRLVALGMDTGQLSWTTRVDNPWGLLACSDLAVFYLNQHSKLVAVNRATGELIWARDLHRTYGWLHASRDRVVVGGWRGYTDIVALDAVDGSSRWSLDARGKDLHSTRVHLESGTLIVAKLRSGLIEFFDLQDGRKVGEFETGKRSEEQCERLQATTGSNQPVVVKVGKRSFVVISGGEPAVRLIRTEAPIWSTNLSVAGSVVPFVTSAGNLAAWHLTENRQVELGPLHHNRTDILPFCELSAGRYAVGTSFGELRIIRESVGTSSRQRVGKRVATGLVLSGSVLVLGTDSGEVMGLNVEGGG